MTRILAPFIAIALIALAWLATGKDFSVATDPDRAWRA